MGAVRDGIDGELVAWIGQQHLFFVSTAPLSGEGHINCSPKGMDSLRVIDGRRVAWLDLTGSGTETIAHLRENGRITLMWCAFTGPPRIVRVQGRGTVHLPGSPGFAGLAPRFPALPGIRSFIEVSADRVSVVCGYGVPRFDFVGDRETLVDWAAKKGDEGLAAYRAQKNATSIDGLPGI
jgi:hypothetical protein